MAKIAANNKLQEIQYMRALAIILVVLQHSIVANLTSSASYTVALICYNIDINTFMFISGYLYEKNYESYRNEGIARFAGKKFSNLIVPYLFWECILYFGAWLVYNGPAALNRFSGILETLGFVRLTIPQILISLVTFNNSYIELYWFLYALFVIFIIHYLTGRLLERKLGIVLVFLGVALVLCFSSEIYIVEKIAISMFVFSAGRLSRSNNIAISAIKFWWMLIAIGIFGLLFITPDVLNIVYIGYVWYLVKHIGLGLCGVVIIAWLAKCINKGIAVVKKGAEGIGKYSLSIYLLHNPWVVKLVSFIAPGGGYIRTCICLIVGVAIPILLDWLIIGRSRILSFFMLGRKTLIPRSKKN